MGKNDKILLDQLINNRKDQIGPELSDSDFFELFVAEELLKNYGLEYDEIESGISGGGNDGGIDGAYGFVDGNLIYPNIEFGEIRDEVPIELVIIQSKRSSSFSESTIKSLITSVNDLLDMDKSLEEMEETYNSTLLGIFRDYRDIIIRLAEKFPKLKFKFYYATKGNSEEVHPNVKKRVASLEVAVNSLFSDVDFSFEFLGAQDLLILSRKKAKSSLSLNISSNVIAEGDSIVCLVNIKEYYNFIIDEDGQRRQNIFGANVREYEGSVQVNRAIRETLARGKEDIDFWWLNNGITIVASKAPFMGKKMSLEDPRVVNGLQTSHEIFKYFSANPDISDNRLILVRIIVTKDEKIRNQIIQATNFQTRILPYSLRATEKIHHDIEQFLGYNGLYYDRQKNYYKNLGKPRSKIISMQYLAQAVAAILLQEPNNARGRPTNLVKDNDTYAKIFNEQYPMKLYLICSKFMKAVDDYFRNEAPEYAKKERTNLRFALACFAASIQIGKSQITSENIVEKINLDDINSEYLTMCLKHVSEVFEIAKEEHNLDGDRVARRKEFDEKIQERIHLVLAEEIDF